jgi:hypothetical protein
VIRRVLRASPLVVAFALAAWSYFAGLVLAVNFRSTTVGVISVDGRLHFSVDALPGGDGGFWCAARSVHRAAARTVDDYPPDSERTRCAFAGFVWTTDALGKNAYRNLTIPWAAAGLIAASPLLAWTYRRQRGRQWAAAGRCGGCGFDLRASLERCPECGRSKGGITPPRPAHNRERSE